MKRLFALALALFITSAMTLTALAAPASLTVTAADARPGSEITVTFGVTAGANLNSGKFIISYDTAVFEYVTDSYEQGDLFNNFINDHNCLNGQVLVAFAGIDPITEAGTFFTLKFKIDSDAKGEQKIYFYADGATDVDGKAIELKEGSATVNLTGEPVTGTDVTPVTSVDANGKTYTVGAQSGGKKTGVVTEWIIAILGVAAITGLAVFVVFMILRTKKKEPVAEPVVQHQSILDDEAKKLLDLGNGSQKEE